MAKPPSVPKTVCEHWWTDAAVKDTGVGDRHHQAQGVARETCAKVQLVNCLGIFHKNVRRLENSRAKMKAQPERQEIMDETKQGERSSSRETPAAVAERQAEAKEIAQSLAGKASAGTPKALPYSPVTVSPESPRGEFSPASDFVGFLKQTKHVWLMVVGTIAGLVVVVTVAQRAFAWFSEKRERRQEQAIASVTPEHLLARCGQPLEDTTKNVYPILMRTMTYQISRSETYIFDFSRTAEENSDWVFLSMKDANGKSYETPEEKVSAMSCLNSRK